MLQRTLAALLCLAFAVPCLGQTTHDGWTVSSVRSELAPVASVIKELGGKYALVLKGNGKKTVDGKWVKRVTVTGGTWVRFDARYHSRKISEPYRHVLATIVWLDVNGNPIGQPEWPKVTKKKDSTGHRAVSGTYQVPVNARQAQLELRFRWDKNGIVEWRDAALQLTSTPAPRTVKIASVNHRPQGTGSPMVNLQQFETYIDQAGSNGANIVCLPEAVTFIGTGKKQFDVAEPIPGPSTAFLGTVAKRNNLYIIVGLYERAGTAMYNTAVLIGRDGKLVGKYRKVCLPREEVEVGFHPGKKFPVFDTDFGRIGMMICWDVTYPDVAHNLFFNGAEMIFMPIWGGDEHLTRARAIENQTHVIIAGYDIRSAIYDRTGTALAKAPSTASTVVYATIDLSQRKTWPGLGDWRSRIWFEGPPR